MVDEGLENLLYKHIQSCSSMEEFINQLSSKRYTRPRISRMLIHILMKNTKNDIHNAMHVDYLRVLAMNQKGRQYLSTIKNMSLFFNYQPAKISSPCFRNRTESNTFTFTFIFSPTSTYSRRIFTYSIDSIMRFMI